MTDSLSKSPGSNDQQDQIASLLSRPKEFLESAEVLVKQDLRLPALALVYTTIDILGWASGLPGQGVKTSFTNWLEDFLFSEPLILCTALELYAARCAILHTLTAESDLSTGKGVRKVYYAWGTGTRDDLQATIRELKENAVAVHIDDLLQALSTGIHRLQGRLLSDSKFRERFFQRAGPKWFTNVPVGAVKNFLYVKGVSEEYKKRTPWNATQIPNCGRNTRH